MLAAAVCGGATSASAAGAPRRVSLRSVGRHSLVREQRVDVREVCDVLEVERIARGRARVGGAELDVHRAAELGYWRIAERDRIP